MTWQPERKRKVGRQKNNLQRQKEIRDEQLEKGKDSSQRLRQVETVNQSIVLHRVRRLQVRRLDKLDNHFAQYPCEDGIHLILFVFQRQIVQNYGTVYVKGSSSFQSIITSFVSFQIWLFHKIFSISTIVGSQLIKMFTSQV